MKEVKKDEYVERAYNAIGHALDSDVEHAMRQLDSAMERRKKFYVDNGKAKMADYLEPKEIVIKNGTIWGKPDAGLIYVAGFTKSGHEDMVNIAGDLEYMAGRITITINPVADDSESKR